MLCRYYTGAETALVVPTAQVKDDEKSRILSLLIAKL